MKLTSTQNGGEVIVSEEYGTKLLESGLFVEVKPPKARKPRAAKPAKEDSE